MKMKKKKRFVVLKKIIYVNVVWDILIKRFVRIVLLANRLFIFQPLFVMTFVFI